MRTDGLVLRYGHVAALDGATLEAPSGAITAILGPNGAGKTTLLRVLATLARPEGGTAAVDGCDVVVDADAVRGRIGLVSHGTLLYPDLTAWENLRFHGRLRGVDGDAVLADGLEAVGLHHRRHDRVRTFSRGAAQRLAIARALLHGPAVLLLDEPHSGLDPEAADALDATLRDLAGRGRAVVLATHDLARAVALAGHIVVLARGRVAWQGPSRDVPTHAGAWYRELVAASTPGRAASAPGRAAATAGPAVGASVATAGTAAAEVRPRLSPATFGETVAALWWKDVTVGWRSREAIPPVVVFALVVIVVFQFALSAEPQLRAAAAPGVLWTALLFGSTLGLGRLMGAEVDAGGSAALCATPVDRGAVFVGKWLAAWVHSIVVLALLLPAMVVLLGTSVPWRVLVVLAAVAAVALAGWTASGVVLGTMAVATRAREVLLPVVLFPVVLPLVVAAVQATGAVLAGGTPGDLVAPVALIAAYDVIFVVLGVLSYGYVLEGS